MTYQASGQSNQKTDFTIDLIWWGFLRLALIKNSNLRKELSRDHSKSKETSSQLEPVRKSYSCMYVCSYIEQPVTVSSNV